MSRTAALALVGTVVVSLLVGVRPALACSCGPPDPGQPSPEVIVVAVAQTALDVPEDGYGGHRWRMRVVGAARGDVKAGAAIDVSVVVGQGGGDCSVTRSPPTAGSTYLLTGGHDAEGTLYVSHCGGSFTPLAEVPGGPISFAMPVPVPGHTSAARGSPGQTALLVPGAGDESHGVLSGAGVALLAAAAGTAMVTSARLLRRHLPPAGLS